MDIITDLSRTFKIKPAHSRNLIGLIEDGCTIPFISHYRKDKVGVIDESTLWAAKKYYYNYNYLQKTKSELINALKSSNKLTNAVKSHIHSSRSLVELDIIRKLFLEKNGLPTKEPDQNIDTLVEKILEQKTTTGDLFKGMAPGDESQSSDYFSTVIDHVVVKLKEDIKIIKLVWSTLYKEAIIKTTLDKTVNNQQQAVEPKRKDRYKPYFNYQEKLRKVAPIDVIIINRGERERIISVRIELPEATKAKIKDEIITNKESIYTGYLDKALEKTLDDVLLPVMIKSLRKEKSIWAEEQRINLYQKNLRSLLLKTPQKGKVILGMDTGHKFGCKVAVVGRNGDILESDTLFTGKINREKIQKILSDLIKKHRIEVISIGNGFRLREVERIVASLKKNTGIRYFIVDEGGIDEYSNSYLANRELRKVNVEFRGAVSIARRCQDPLSELVKVDPKKLRLGSYQYEVNQKQLSRALLETISSCVNFRRVNVNTATTTLLYHVSGLNTRVVNSIISTRDQEGDFRSREDLKNVKGLNNKIFEQCSGFLLVHGKNPLDESPIHPEKYYLAGDILNMVGAKPSDLRKKQTRHKVQSKLKMNYSNIIDRYSDTEGRETVTDIIEALGNLYSDSIEIQSVDARSKEKIRYDDIVKGSILSGKVVKVTDYGAFINIGLRQHGMVHISELSSNFVRHPSEVVHVGDIVDVKVIDIDKTKKRISLSMKNVVSAKKREFEDSSFRKDAERLDKLKSMRKSGNIRFK
ncbi:MAG: S1 RNA-binding domain-containing protein [Candidatus Hodarchaeales archaeon]